MSRNAASVSVCSESSSFAGSSFLSSSTTRWIAAFVCVAWGHLSFASEELGDPLEPIGSGFAGDSKVLDEESSVVDFARQIRPILAENCLLCHGPDENERKADLRFDTEAGAFADLGGYSPVVAGDPSNSEMYLRITDSEYPMPPAKTGLSLTEEERELVRRWIEQGADWGEHWAYVAPVRPALPDAKQSAANVAGVAGIEWARNPIDHFVLEGLQSEGLQPSPEADASTLLRRASLDITGLPPAAELRAETRRAGFDATHVDQLLASPSYGEHSARHWLDAARYGDTHGLHLDNERSMWPYRDWVVGAFNRNLPFDQFTIEQLAGDLLPEASLEQRIASGFNRCNATSAEGGMIAEEYLDLYAKDRVETTTTVWMGMTMGCAQCHDHKYDPLAQKEFYEFYAFFNSITESASDQNIPNPPPFVKAASQAQLERLASYDRELEELKSALYAPDALLDAGQAAWTRDWQQVIAQRWQPLQLMLLESTHAETGLQLLEDGSVLATGPVPANGSYEVLLYTEAERITSLRLDLLRDESLPKGGVSRASHGNIVLTEFEVEAAPASQPHRFTPVHWARVSSDHSQVNFDVSKAIDGDPMSGWAISGKIEDRMASFTSDEAFGFEGGTLLRVRLKHDSQYTEHLIGRFRLSLSEDASLAPALLSDWYLAETVLPDHFAAQGELGAGSKASPALGDWHDYAFPIEEQLDLDGLRVSLSADSEEAEALWRHAPELVDGQIQMLKEELGVSYLYRTVHVPQTAGVGADEERKFVLLLGSDDSIKLWVNGEQAFENKVARPVKAEEDRAEIVLQPGRNELLMKVVNTGGKHGFYFRVAEEHIGGLPLGIERALSQPEPDRSNADLIAVRDHYRRSESTLWEQREGDYLAMEQERVDYDAAIPTSLVMEEAPEPRPAFVLSRGQYDDPKEQVQRSTPGVLPALQVPEGQVPNRLDLAKWLVDPAHPLTARVAVNRLWHRYFGRGLVSTLEDFGTRGAMPSHPELLDWLAVELVESGWDLKHIQRLIVNSATYRQSSRSSEDLLARDPNNVLLARGPRFRKDAEVLRDSVLHASGLLVDTIGGPPVRPYQPEGVWNAVAYTRSNTANFMRGTGDDLYRRSIYTFWKRTAPPPNMVTFDAPSRELCSVARERTNTPLQALNLMNDVQYVEAARALAERALKSSDSFEAQLTAAYDWAVARDPRAAELAILKRLYLEQLAIYQADEQAAAQLLETGESMRDSGLDLASHAAWTVVANTILNLDEFITRG